ncbi:MAG TPA: ATP-binding protein [Stellaceae bacterium]|nr:ATP-binding protein [Stellaceae bacterium]
MLMHGQIGDGPEKLEGLAERLEAECDRRSEVERELKETSELLHATFDAAPFPIQIVGADLRVVMWNAAAESAFGYPAAEMIGNSMLKTVPDEFKDNVREGFGEIASGAPSRRVLRPVLHRDGRRREAYVCAAPIFAPDGRVRAVVVTFEDVTDQLKIEAQLRQAQKMEAIGNLTGGIAHDFNNLLAIIVGNLDLAKLTVEPTSEAAELVEESLTAALRGAELTQRLLAFARRQPLSPARLSVNELITGMVKFLERTLGEQITIGLELGSDLWPVDADAAQLETAIVNLATNARDAMQKGGTLTIASRNRRLDEDYAAGTAGLLPGDYVVIEVSDTGVGMTPSVLGQIFEPFYTTKEAGKGTGLGLSMVFGFLKQSGGHVTVYSEPGLGTTFRLYLPRALAEMAEPPSSLPDAAVGAGEVVLAVEDNDGLRRVVVRQLRDLGYRVFEAESAAAALALLECERIDLVFTDVVMPGEIDGFGLAQAVLDHYPSTKIVLTSGFPDTKLNGALAAMTDQVRLLSKPYRKDELARLLREAFER